MEYEKSVFNVLTVDDNPNNLFTLKELIKKTENIKIYEAASGHEALQTALEQDINLILLDVQMPKMDGFEIAKLLKLKNKTKDIPIVFLTAVFKTDEFFKQGYKLGAVDYLTKPFDDNLLINKIELYKSLFEKQKEVEKYTQKLIEQNKVFHAIFDYSGMGIIVTDRDGVILQHNVAFERITGHNKRSIDGMNIFDITHNDDLGISHENFNNLKENVADSYIMEKRYLKKIRYLFKKVPVYLIIDDTLVERNGKKIEEAQKHFDHNENDYVNGHQFFTALLYTPFLQLPLFPELYSKNTDSKIEMAQKLVTDFESGKVLDKDPVFGDPIEIEGSINNLSKLDSLTRFCKKLMRNWHRPQGCFQFCIT